MRSELPIIVRSTHTDMLGHVNNATYQQYLEWGRFDWFRRAKIPLDAFTRRDLAAVVARVEIDYRREARMDDALTVETELCHLGRKSLHFAQRVRHMDGGVACEAKVITVVFDQATRRSAFIPEPLRPHLETLLVVT